MSGATDLKIIDELVVADIGGTHARFAIARIDGGKIASLEHIEKLKSADHPSLQTAWEAYRDIIDRDLPKAGAFAVAGPVGGDVLYFTNSSWMLRPAQVDDKLGLTSFVLINDFGAVGHAAAQLDEGHFAHVCGPDQPLATEGSISIVGPGTGLGVAQLLRMSSSYYVIETEGGHIDFAPHDGVEDRILSDLRGEHGRVSVERIVSGQALRSIYRTLSEMEGKVPQDYNDIGLWQTALGGEDSIANAAFDRFCLCLGSVTGDIALAQGANSVVLAGGLGARIGDRLQSSGFRERFVAKGRFRTLMETIPVKRLLHPEPGLFGAAAAYIQASGTVLSD